MQDLWVFAAAAAAAVAAAVPADVAVVE
jgi:hypothetical protein